MTYEHQLNFHDASPEITGTMGHAWFRVASEDKVTVVTVYLGREDLKTLAVQAASALAQYREGD